MQDDDSVKAIFGKTAEEIFTTDRSHSDVHSSNAFCGNAGPEEMKHFQHLLDELTDGEIALLTDAVGISFGMPASSVERDQLEGVLDEADRETFYREYNRLMDERRFASQNGIDKVSGQYGEACRAYINLVDPKRLDRTFEDMARWIRDEEPDKPLHPMLRAVASLAWDIAEQDADLSPPDQKEEKWQELTKIVNDFLAGKWQTTAWSMSGTYLHDSRKRGFGFVAGFRDAKPYVEVADASAHKSLEAVVKKLNPKQTQERFLQNLVLALPEAIGEYRIDGIQIKERLA